MTIKMIDLGLPSGTKWADRNIGAEKPEDYGQYFMHGDTEGFFGDENPKLTGYYNDGVWSGMYSSVKAANYPYDSNNPDLPLAFDTARKKMGTPWKMPTKAQFIELFNSEYTTNVWTTLNGINGRLVTSKINGNSIFFPAAGYVSANGVGIVGSNGCYWSSSLSSQGGAFELSFFSDGVLPDSVDVRFCGNSVRAVC